MKEVLIETIELFQEKIDQLNYDIEMGNSNGYADDALYVKRDWYEKLQFDAQLELDKL